MAGQVAIGHHGHQTPRLRQPVQGPAQVVARHTFDGSGRRDDTVQRAVVRQPLGRRLRTHLVHARHVVHGVANERQVVDDALRRHAELRQHPGLVQRLVAHGVDQRDRRRHQLRQILVARGDHHPVPAGRTHAGERADGVVCLDARHLQHRPSQQAHHFVDGPDLLGQRLGHGRTMGLVLAIPGIAEGVALGIEHTGGVSGRHLLAQALHHRHHAVHGTRGEAVWPAQVRHGVVGAVEVAGSIHQQQGMFAHQGLGYLSSRAVSAAFVWSALWSGAGAGWQAGPPCAPPA